VIFTHSLALFLRRMLITFQASFRYSSRCTSVHKTTFWTKSAKKQAELFKRLRVISWCIETESRVQRHVRQWPWYRCRCRLQPTTTTTDLTSHLGNLMRRPAAATNPPTTITATSSNHQLLPVHTVELRTERLNMSHIPSISRWKTIMAAILNTKLSSQTVHLPAPNRQPRINSESCVSMGKGEFWPSIRSEHFNRLMKKIHSYFLRAKPAAIPNLAQIRVGTSWNEGIKNFD